MAHALRKGAVGVATALLVTAIPGAVSIPVLGMQEYFVGVLRDGDVDASGDYPPAWLLGPPLCAFVVSWLEVTLTLYAPESRAQLEVHVGGIGGPTLLQGTSGMPPTATIAYENPTDCATFTVRALHVPVPTPYDVAVAP